MSKVCKYCNLEKKLEYFTINNRYKDRHENRCKECQSLKNKENRERLREAHRRWKEKNPEYYKKYGEKEEVKEYVKNYYQENKQKYKDRKKQWRKDNPEREAENRNNYKENNRVRLNEYARKWKQQKRDIDKEYKIKENISRRIRYELCSLLKCKKSKKTVEYLGCKIEELKEYLEKKFSQDMTWDNYGDIWHIDHIIPCKAWNLQNECDNICCWNYRNLQPLFSSENHSKKDKYSEHDKTEYINILKNLKII